MIESKILWQGKLGATDIKVNISQQSNRKIDPEVESKLQERWEDKLHQAEANNTVLYDGISYRLEKLTWKDGVLMFNVSPMQFSIRSTLKRMPELEELGEGYYSHGLSVGGLVVANDNKFVFIKKNTASASSLQEDIVGGVLEEIEPVSGLGIINANLKELKEEINVDPDMVKDMKVIGIVRSPSTDIVIVTYTLLRLSTFELMETFKMRSESEVESIIIVEEDKLTQYLESLGGYKPLFVDLLRGV